MFNWYEKLSIYFRCPGYYSIHNYYWRCKGPTGERRKNKRVYSIFRKERKWLKNLNI